MALLPFITVSDVDAPYEVREAQRGRFFVQVKASKTGDAKASWMVETGSGHYMASGYAADLTQAQVDGTAVALTL